jgi:hypothetical protein
MTQDDAMPGEEATATAPHDDLVMIRVMGMPIAVQARAQEHADELTRELTLIGAQLRQEGNTRDLPALLVTLIEQLNARYSRFTTEQEQLVAEATARGDDTIDLTYQLPASAAAHAQELGALLDQADAYCRTGRHLLTLATPDDLVAFRRWYLSQFIDQVAGQPPVPWDVYLQRADTSGQ